MTEAAGIVTFTEDLPDDEAMDAEGTNIEIKKMTFQVTRGDQGM